MYNIKTYNKISSVILEVLPETVYNISDSISEPDGAIVRSLSLHDKVFPKSLLAIARAGAGTNNIPTERLSEEGVVVFNTPSANANAVKELVVFGLLAASRKVIDGIMWARSLKGQEDIPALVEKGKGAFVGPELRGKTLGVIGLGAIGVLVANAAKSLGMTVYGYDPFLSLQNAWNLSHSIKRAENLDEIFNTCDYITLHIPENKDTRNIINADSIKKMKNGVRVINFSRAALVNSADMIEALQSKKVSSYVVDFPTEEMLGVDGVVAIPHLGASTPESEENCAIMAARELKEYIEDGNITNSVNFPSLSMPRSGKYRITVIHRNIPSMLTSITAVLANDGVNIENLTNKSRAEYAYTMLDVDELDCESVRSHILAIDGVIRVRII